MRLNLKFIIVLAMSCCVGLFLAWMDSRPGWDDSGITAGLIVLSAALFGYLYPVRPWVWALTVSIWIPLHPSPSPFLTLPLLSSFTFTYLCPKAPFYD
ncbi:MAG: hypothetical protein WCI31_00805 [Prolixibacteraceae bacterium]